MKLVNFKSYGGERVVGPFHKRFSSIVGPNGSGKSNVIDAMLFVFGKKAKKLRLNKVSELIHKSDGFPNLDFCQVEVHFCDIMDNKDDDDEYTVVPDTGLVVTRIAYRNNTSKYLVDGKTRTFTEVGQLLRKRGIDLDNNRFLILQGEVEQIAMMAPKAKTEHDEGLLEFLEDIIGSNKHLEAINESEKALEGFNEARGEKLARLKVTESERDNLEGAKKEAEESVRKGREVRSKQNILYQRHAVDAATHAEEARAKYKEIEEKRKHESAKLEEKNKVVAEKEAEGKSIGADHEAICKELEKTKREFTAFERQDIKLREDIKSHKAAKKKLEAAAKKEVEKEAAAKAAAKEKEGSLPALQIAVENTAATRAEKEGELDRLQEMVKGENEATRAEVEERTAAIAPVKQAMAEVEASIGTTETEIALVKEAATSAQKEVAHCEAELARITNDAAAKKDAVEGTKVEIETKEARLAEVGKELAAAEASQVARSASMTAAVAKAEEAKTALGSQSATGRGVVGQLMAAAKAGKPLARAGVVGRLGDLGAIDSKFDVAISTACG